MQTEGRVLHFHDVYNFGRFVQGGTKNMKIEIMQHVIIAFNKKEIIPIETKRRKEGGVKNIENRTRKKLKKLRNNTV